jgi:hypothetical protein
MKSATAGTSAHLAGYGTTMALCVKAKRQDGTLFGWAEHDLALTVDLSDGDGAIVYSPSEGFSRAAIKTSAGLKVDETEAESFFATAGIAKSDLRAGLWDFADIWMFLVNWADTSQFVRLRRGKLGRVVARDDAFTAELRSLFELYNQELVRLYHPACGVELGSSVTQQGGGCGVRLPPPVWQANTAYSVRARRDAASGSVVRPSVFNDLQYRCIEVSGSPNLSGSSEPTWPTSIGSPSATVVDGAITWEAEQALYLEARVVAVTSRRVFALDYAGAAPAARITGGRVTFTSGLNVGTTHEIKRYTVSGAEVELYLPAPYDLNAGSPNDSVTIVLGCDKSRSTCRDFFDNVWNYQGYPDIPGNDQVFAFPDAVA